MKSKISLLVVLIILLFSCNNPSESEGQKDEKIETEVKIKTDLEKQDLKGDVISVNEIIYYAKSDNSDELGDLYNRYYKEFDKNGFMTSLESYGSEDYLIRKSLNFSDNNGLITESEIYDQDNELINRELYKYDDKGNLVQVSVKDPNGDNGYIRYYKSDSDGNVISISTRYGENDEEHFKSSFKYNNKGYRVEAVYEDNSSDYNRKYYYEFDENGLQNKTTSYTENDELIKEVSHEYSFDDSGNWIKQLGKDRGRSDYITMREIEYK
jgi:hypothetical protein